MESKGEIYQGNNEQSQTGSQQPQVDSPQPTQQQGAQRNMSNNENTAVNKLFSLGLVLLAASVIITVFYLFSVSEVVQNFSIDLPKVNLPF